MTHPQACALVIGGAFLLAGCTGTSPGWTLSCGLVWLVGTLLAGCVRKAPSEECCVPDAATASEDTPDAGIPTAVEDTPDAGIPSQGNWESCCTHNPDGGRGIVSSCYCPPNMSCNYGMGVSYCADGTCVSMFDGTACPEWGDAGASWSPCCDLSADGHLGVLTVCYCPPLAVCNYGLGLEICGDGTCTYNFTGDAGCPQPDAGDVADAGP
jgi:hypothetical protein